MPIFKDIGLVFVHIPKTAGTSIDRRCFELTHLKRPDLCLQLSAFDLYDKFGENTLTVSNALYQNDLYKDASVLYAIKKHAKYDKMLLLYPEIKNLKAFTVVRNPYDRIISYFYFFLNKKYAFFENAIYNSAQVDLSMATDYFNIFIANLLTSKMYDFSLERSTQKSFISNKNAIVYDNICIIKYENLLDELRLKVPELFVHDKTLPHIKHRDSSTVINFHREIISPQAKQAINTYFAEDFKYFNYAQE